MSQMVLALHPLLWLQVAGAKNMTEDQVEVSKHWLQHGANVNEWIGSTGCTALQIAITHGLDLLRE